MQIKIFTGLLEDKKGIAFIAALALTALIALVGAITVISTVTDIKISSNYKTGVQALYAAQAGANEAKLRLKGTPTSNTAYVGDPVTSDKWWSAYILTSNTWQLSDDPYYNTNYKNYIPINSNYTNTNVIVNSLQSDISYWVKVRHKREYDAERAGHSTTTLHYYDGDGDTSLHTEADPGNIIYYGYWDPSSPTTRVQFTTANTTIYKPVEVITAYGSSGNSSSVIEIEAVRYVGPPILATLYSKGKVTINGSSATIDGTDNCGNTAPLPPIFTLSSVEDNGNPVYGGNPPAPVENGGIDIDISSYVDNLKDNATIIITSDQNNTNYGDLSNFVTCYSDTSNPYNNNGLKMQNVTGYGTLLVEGDLVMGGGFTWYGLIIATGKITLNGGGPSSINIYGAAFSNQVVDINGGLNLMYDSCMIDNALSSQSLSIISWREVY